MKFRLASAAAIVVLLSGCQQGTLMPYVLPYGPDARADTACPTTITDSISCARYLQSILSDSVRNSAYTESVAGSLLIPLAAIVAFKGFNGSNTHNVAALASGGVAMYGVSQYLSSHPRELIYISGIAALDCAINIASGSIVTASALGTVADFPNRILSAQADAKLLISKIEALRALVNGYSTQAAQLKASNSTLSVALTAAIAPYSTAYFTQSNQTVSDLNLRLIQADTRVTTAKLHSEEASRDLLNASYGIIGQVNKQVGAMLPDLASLQSQLTNLKLPQAVAPKVAPTDSSATVMAPNHLLADAKISMHGQFSSFFGQTTSAQQIVDELHAAAVEIDSLSAALAATVANIEARSNIAPEPTPNATYANCNITPPASTAIALSKYSGTVNPGGKLSITLTGGSGIYTAQVTNPPKDPTQVVVTPSTLMSGKGTLDMTATTSAISTTPYQIVIKDGNGLTANFALTVVAAQ